ncbi:5190_t:CDS:2 [Entrophospora sp. SA101]|nr:5190_t:CDS:2 [Entrophospora sp. SA101]CAJ0919870.1 10642_t:CDS:2 [Entrophospora sp. SA101]
MSKIIKEKRSISIFKQGISKCSVPGMKYAKCITSQLDNIQKDLCLKEFQEFKQCVQKVIGKSW